MNYLQILSSFKREIWEYKKSLVWTPLVLAILLFILLASHLLALNEYQAAKVGEFIALASELNDNSARSLGRNFAFVLVIFIPFLLIAVILQIKYFLACLFDERRDLSVYFWRSLPVSDAQTIAVKFVTGAFVIPLVFIVAGALFIIAALLLASLVSVFGGLGPDTSIWTFFSSIGILGPISTILIGVVAITIWLFPVITWLMLASMIAQRAPFLWAVLPVLAILIAEFIFVEIFGNGSFFFIQILEEYFRLNPGDSVNIMLNSDNMIVQAPLFVNSIIFAKAGIVPIGIGCLFLAATYWLRVNRSHEA
ncbi:hypothetical protein [Glaciecola petra]|uniref:ABC transporter permease n=1 Tax=Glaciecola petra TaxID=3075602 RepID=A0ABU2ZQM8_9ALTE|nr:hypothetical protein [Aestuariibacter sp. P117]MDT0594925.1 hypothetical protein [Aestuariibacter sp. P117]